ncbi:pyridoxamine 5'-phosphate oxidase family protein [Faecalibacillus intestinalis]|uniref:pyridoxamine 5'-phosphate oxidase family protein n=1 Tax=Faecalibacillus intestinalis TaxID=1982626 RepID=UPI0039935ADE
MTDLNKIIEIIKNNQCCRLGFIDQESVYIVPLNYGYLYNNKHIFYFHGAKVGKKINLIKQNNHIGFEIDNNHQLVEGKTPCQYSMKYQSIIGKGHIELIEDNEEKKLGLQLIMKNVAHQDVTFSNQMISNVAVMKLIVDTLSCKEHQ